MVVGFVGGSWDSIHLSLRQSFRLEFFIHICSNSGSSSAIVFTCIEYLSLWFLCVQKKKTNGFFISFLKCQWRSSDLGQSAVSFLKFSAFSFTSRESEREHLGSFFVSFSWTHFALKHGHVYTRATLARFLPSSSLSLSLRLLIKRCLHTHTQSREWPAAAAAALLSQIDLWALGLLLDSNTHRSWLARSQLPS